MIPTFQRVDGGKKGAKMVLGVNPMNAASSAGNSAAFVPPRVSVTPHPPVEEVAYDTLPSVDVPPVNPFAEDREYEEV